MNRITTLAFATALPIVVGCGLANYEGRLERSYQRRQYRAFVDQNLAPPPGDQGKFKALNVYVRPPKGMELAKTFFMVNVGEPEAKFDLFESFQGSPKAAEGGATKSEGQPGEGAGQEQAAVGGVVKLHVVGRVKQTAKKKTPGKGEAPPAAADTSGRLPFPDEVRGILSSEYGIAELPKLKRDNHGPTWAPARNAFDSATVKKPNSEDVVRVYFYKQGDFEIAEIWDIPGPLANNSDLSEAIGLSLKEFAVGNRARRAFEGASDEDAGGGGGGSGATTAF